MYDGRSLTVQLLSYGCTWSLVSGGWLEYSSQGAGRGEGGVYRVLNDLETSQGVGMTFLNQEKGERSLTM